MVVPRSTDYRSNGRIVLVDDSEGIPKVIHSFADQLFVIQIRYGDIAVSPIRLTDHQFIVDRPTVITHAEIHLDDFLGQGQHAVKLKHSDGLRGRYRAGAKINIHQQRGL